jgi:hypothetical protein
MDFVFGRIWQELVVASFKVIDAEIPEDDHEMCKSI